MLRWFRSRNDEQEITVSNRTIVRFLGLVLLAYIFVLAFRQASHALILIFTALFLSVALNAPVHWLAQRLPGKRRGSRSLATALSFLLVVLLMAAFLASLIPPLVRQTSSFIDSAPRLVNDLRSEDSSLGRFVRRYHLEDDISSFSNQLGDRLHNVTGSLVGTITRITSSIFSVLTVLVLTFMMLIEGPRWLTFFRRLMPDDQEAHARRLSTAMYKVIKGFVNGQVLLAFIAACLILPILLILHVSYPLALMFVVFVCGLIPLVGHTLGAIIVSTVALFRSPLVALIVLAYYFLYQQIENYAIQPRIQANSTDMSPLLVFTSVIVGVSFNGLLGGLVAIPVAGCLRILILDYLNTHNLLEPEQPEKRVIKQAES